MRQAATTSKREKQFGEKGWICATPKSFDRQNINLRHLQTLISLTHQNRLFSQPLQGCSAGSHVLCNTVHHKMLPLAEAVHTEMSNTVVPCTGALGPYLFFLIKTKLQKRIIILLSNVWQQGFFAPDPPFSGGGHFSEVPNPRAETEVQISASRGWEQEAFQHSPREYFPLHSLSPLASFVVSTVSNKSN